MTTYSKHVKRSHNSHRCTAVNVRHYKAKAYTAPSAAKNKQIPKAWGRSLSSIFRAMLPSREND